MPRLRPLFASGLACLLMFVALGRAAAQSDEAGDEVSAHQTESVPRPDTAETPEVAASDAGEEPATETAETSEGSPDVAEASEVAEASDARPDAPANTVAPATTAAAELGPKIAVVLVGDPDDRLREWANRVERALEEEFERPFDPMLRAALRGGLGDPEDGFAEVRRERRRLGLSEADDVPILTRIGRRAGAAAIAVVRRGDDGPEVVVLDVRRASFFEGALGLSADSHPRIARFVGARARSAARGAPSATGASAGSVPLPPVTAPAAATEPDPEDEEEPDFFERYWPYGAALLLLGAFVAIIAATASTDGGDQPVLRFVPGGR